MANKTKTFFKNGGKGVAIGIACIIPGISGGTLALMLGIYKTIVESVSNLFKRFGKNFLILLPIMIGVIVGVAALWYPLHLAFQFALIPIVAFFAGLIIGGIPGITDEVKGQKISPWNIILCVLAFVVAAGIGILSIFTGANGVIDDMYSSFPWYLYLIVFFVGIAASLALIVPGVSGSMLLLVLGFYAPTLSLVDNFKNGTNIGQSIGLLGCMALGVLVGFFLFAKLMNYLLDKHRLNTMWVIIGFVIGSVIAIFFNGDVVEAAKIVINENQWWMWLIGAVAIVVGFIGSYFFVIYTRKHKVEEQPQIENEQK